MFSIVSIVISFANVTSPHDCSIREHPKCQIITADQMSQLSQVFRIAPLGCFLRLVGRWVGRFFGQVMSPHHSDQMSQRLQVSRIALQANGRFVGTIFSENQ